MSWGPWGVFLIAILDSAGIPIPAGVDAMLIILGAMNPRSALLASALAVLGSTIGCQILFFIGQQGGRIYLDKKASSGKARKFRDWFQQYGLWTVFFPTLIPIPLPTKVFVLSAGALGVSPWRFMLVVLAARIPRYLGLAYCGYAYGQPALLFMKQNSKALTIFGLVLFGAFVTFTLLREKLRKERVP
jgi:membrane protein DedA with SNARE-associated domain